MNICIEDIAEKMEEVDDLWHIFLNRNTGQFISVEKEYFSIAEESDDDDSFNNYDDWEIESIKDSIYILEHWEEYIELPSQYQIHEYSIMEDFIDEINDNIKRNKLYKAISGRGAFRRFKDRIYDMGLEKTWFDFKYHRYLEIAKSWCEANCIEYTPREK